jgi:TPR repeat protein
MKLLSRSFFASTLAVGAITFANNIARSAQQPAPAPASATPSDTMPGIIGMCEDSDGCSDWGFKGSQGLGLWADGASADLTITHLDANSITVHRIDSKGTGAGIVADYSGTIVDNWIEGDVTATWAGHQNGETHTKWHGLIFPSQAIVQNTRKIYEDSLKQATSWAMCSDFGDRCFAANASIDILLVMAGQAGAMRMMLDGTAHIFVHVDQGRDGAVAIRRFDRTGIVAGATILYTGKREGNKITGTFKAIWPGHNNSPLPGNFVATLAPDHCTPTMNAATAMQTGLMANLLEDKFRSFNCFLTAANQGDSSAKATLGLYYYAGWGTAVDYTKALHWLTAAGNQDDALMGLSVMYQNGQGVPVDLLMGHYLADRVELGRRYRNRFPNGQPPAFAADIVNTLGDLFGWVYNLGDNNAIKPLAAKVAHKRAIIDYMHQGLPRVEAEKRYYADLQEQRAATHTECKEPDFSNPVKRYANSDAGFWERETDEEDAGIGYGMCLMMNPISNQAFQQAMQGYLGCVEKNIDSNTIEQKCEFPLPRFGF